MLKINAGTTPSLQINLENFSLDKVVSGKLTFSLSKTNKNIILVKRTADMTFNYNTIDIKLSENDTLLLNALNVPDALIYVQLRLKDSDDELYTSDIIEVSVGNLLDWGAYDE